MNQHSITHSDTDAYAHDDFLLRFRKNLLKEIFLVVKYASMTLRFFLAFFIGFLLFLSGFNFVRIVFALIIPPLFIFIVGNHLTLLSSNLVIIMTAVSIASLFLSEQGENFVGWFFEIISSLFEVASGSSLPSSLSQKLMGFMTFSVVIGIFLVLLI